MAAARARLDGLAKPPGSLGRLESLAVTLAGVTGQPRPRLPRKAVIVAAADHGVAREGVSAYRPEVTARMVRTFLAGGAAINVLARQAGARVIVVDVGVAGEVAEEVAAAESPGIASASERGATFVSRRVALGTANLVLGPAMTRDQMLAALAVGIDVLEAEAARGLDLVATGEMGIGNTTPSSAIVVALTGAAVETVTGRGSGVGDAGYVRKLAAVERALAHARPDPERPLDTLAALGGLEIAALVGVILAAAARRLPILLDGFISGAAALIAVALCPAVRHYLIASHRSAEIGHRLTLERLGLTPLLTLDLRLGEGTGAALAMPLVDAALAILADMSSGDEVGLVTS